MGIYEGHVLISQGWDSEDLLESVLGRHRDLEKTQQVRGEEAVPWGRQEGVGCTITK